MPLLESLFSPGTIERLGWMLVHFLWQATAVALLLAMLLRLLQRVGANMRYAAACGALALMVVLPVVTMQFVEVSGPGAEAGPPLELPSLPVVEPLPVTVVPAGELPPLEIVPAMEKADVAVPVPLRQRVIAAVEPALPYVVLGWLAGVLGLSAWHLGGWTQLHRLKRRMTCEADARLRATLKELAVKLGIRRTVTLLESAIVEVPTVLGWLRPVILIPASALTGLTPDQLRAILAHELAHIRRWDYLANILQTVVEILGFYHPAVWWVSSRIRIERENCCDDLAVHVCGNSLQYARALTSLEEMRHSRSDLALAASGGSLMARIARLLGRPVVNDRRFAWLPGLIALLLVVGMIIPATLMFARSTPAFEPLPPKNPTSVDAEQVPNADVTTVVESSPRDNAAEPNETQILTDWVIAKVRTETALDRTTKRLIADVLAVENPQAAKELADAEEMTLGQAIREYVARQSLSQETGRGLIDLLKALELATVQASPSLTAADGWQFELRNISQEWFSSRLLRPAQAGEEPNLIRFEYGTTIKGTARAENDASVTLDMDVWSSEPEPKADPNDLPIVRRTATSTTVNVPEDRYFSLLVESPNRQGRQAEEAESLLVMVKPSVPKSAPEPAVTMTRVVYLNRMTAQRAKELLPREYRQYVQTEDRDDSDPDEPGRILTITAPMEIANTILASVAELDKPPRQVLLDVRVIEMKRANLLNLGVEWSFPIIQGVETHDGGDWTKAISIGYSADSASTSSLLKTLNQLETTGRGEIVTNPQIVSLDGGTAQLRSIREEWFLMSDPSAFLPPELQNIESGMIMSMTPHFGDNNDITLEMAIEVSESFPEGRASDLPIVTRRQAKNKVTILNGGTVAVAGLIAKSAEQTGQTMNELAIFVTATLVPENGRVVSSLPSPRETASPGTRADRVESADSPNRSQTAASDAHLGHLDNARRMHANLDPLVRAISVEIARIERNQIVLRQTRAEANPELVRQQALLETLQDRFHSRWTELEQEFDRDLLLLSLRTMADRDAYVNSDPVVQDLAASIVSMEKELSVLRQTHLPSHPTLQQKQGNLQDLYRRLEERRKTLRDEFDAGARTVRQTSPTDPQRISATFTRDDLLAVLARISKHFGEDIAVDGSVKTQPITAGLVEASVETALREILRETPYTFKRTSETNRPTYLVCRPITAEFEHADLLQALDQIAGMVEVPIIPAPSVQGRITAQLKETDLETALRIILQETPFVFRRVGDYYIVDDVQSGELGPLGTAVRAETQTPSTTAKADSSAPSQIRRNKKRPIQILLDARIVEIERTDLTNLIAQWNLPVARVDQTPPDGRRPEGIQIAFLPDRARTDSFWEELRLLVTTQRARVMDSPQVVSTDGHPIELLSFGEEWANCPDPESAREASRGREECRKILAGTSLLATPTVGDSNDITLEMEIATGDSVPKRRRNDRPIAMRRVARDSVTVTDGGIIAVAGLPVRSQARRATKVIAIFVTATCIPDEDEVISSYLSREKTSPPALVPAGGRAQIHLTATLARIPSDRTLDPETAAKVFSLIAPAGDEQPAMSLDDLCASGVERVLSVLAGQTADGRFQDVIQFLESKGFLDRQAEPQLCVRLGEQAHISGGGSLTLDLRPEMPDGGRGIQLDVEASVDIGRPPSRGGARAVLASTQFLRSSGRVKIRDERHGFLLLGAIKPETAPADAETYCLIFRAAVVSPDVPSA